MPYCFANSEYETGVSPRIFAVNLYLLYKSIAVCSFDNCFVFVSSCFEETSAACCCNPGTERAPAAAPFNNEAGKNLPPRPSKVVPTPFAKGSSQSLFLANQFPSFPATALDKLRASAGG